MLGDKGTVKVPLLDDTRNKSGLLITFFAQDRQLGLTFGKLGLSLIGVEFLLEFGNLIVEPTVLP